MKPYSRELSTMAEQSLQSRCLEAQALKPYPVFGMCLLITNMKRYHADPSVMVCTHPY